MSQQNFITRFPLELFFSSASSLYLHKVANSTCKQLLKDSWPSIWWRLQASITVIWLESRSSSIFIIWKIASKGNEKSFLFKTQSHLNNSCHYLKIAISLGMSKEIFCIVWKNKEVLKRQNCTYHRVAICTLLKTVVVSSSYIQGW